MDGKYKNKKIITKAKLYQKPDLSDVKLPDHDPEKDHYPGPNQSGGFKNDWTQDNFKRAQHTTVEPTLKRKILKKSPGILKDLLKPSFTSKAQRMMQKMGWEGGALGRTGEGIVEPIIPDITMIKSKAGFGNPAKNYQTQKQQNQMRNRNTIANLLKTMEQRTNKENFNTNILLEILDFVQDDSESELVFDCGLSKNERRAIHHIVNELIESEVLVSYDSNAVLDLCEYVQSCSKLTFKTESKGTPPSRYLHVYKTAPKHVYLVTPEDFDHEDEAVLKFGGKHKQTMKKLSKKTKDLYPEKKLKSVKDISEEISHKNVKDNTTEEFNPVDIQIDVDHTPDKSKKSNILYQNHCTNEMETSQQKWIKEFAKKLTDFVLEFSEGKKYTEIRFLGKFKSEELDFIEDFTSNLHNFDDEEVTIGRKEEINNILSKHNKILSTENDCNGSIVITKTYSLKK